MDIAFLSTFLEVARLRHFGRAADSLHVTQSAVSARIKMLETSLGVTLFERRRNAIELTAAGEKLVRHARLVVDGWARARVELAGVEENAMQLVVAFPLDLWSVLVSHWAALVRDAHPQLVLELQVRPQAGLAEHLASGKCDLAIMFDPPALAGLELRQLSELSIRLVSTEAGTCLDEALHGNYLYVDWGANFALQHAQSFDPPPAPAMRMGQGVLAREYLLANPGSAYLAEPMIAGDLAQGRLFAVEAAPVIRRAVYAVYRPSGERAETLLQSLGLLPR